MSLLRFLRESRDARKVFGRRELRIIEKQLLGVNLTQSERNRLSRDIRRKFEFIGKASIFEEEFRLIKGTEIKKKIEEAKEVILDDISFKKIKRIILYGSAIENELSLKSDIDIAVEFGKISLREATLFRKRISGKVNERIDIQVYNYLPAKIRKEIIKGRVMYDKQIKRQDRRN